MLMRGPAGRPEGRLLAEAAETATDAELLDAVAHRVVRMRMSVPAVFFLESIKPMSYVGSQALVFFEPFVQTLFTVRSYQRFAALLEDRENLERLIQRIEAIDNEVSRKERAEKKARREAARATTTRRHERVRGWLARWTGRTTK